MLPSQGTFYLQGGPHLVCSVAPVLTQIFMSQDSVLSIKQEVQELQAVDGAHGTGGGSHLGKEGTGVRVAQPLLPISHLHTTPGLSSPSSMSTQSRGLASTSTSVLRG